MTRPPTVPNPPPQPPEPPPGPAFEPPAGSIGPPPEPFVYDPNLEEHPTTLDAELGGRGLDDTLANAAAEGPGDVKARVRVTRTGYELRLRVFVTTQDDRPVSQVDLWFSHDRPGEVDWVVMATEPEFAGQGWLSHMGSTFLEEVRDLGFDRLVVKSYTPEQRAAVLITGLKEVDGELKASLIEGRMPEYFDFKAGLRPEPQWRVNLRGNG